MKQLLSTFMASPFWKRRSLTGYAGLLALAALFLISCEEQEAYGPVKDGIPTLTASANDLSLRQSASSNTAVSFTWTAGSNYGTNAAIDYALEFSPKGENFASPVTLEMGRAKYTHSFKVADLNNLLLNEFGFTPGEASELDVRVKSTTADDSVEPDYSNVISLQATPFAPVTPTLYMIGDATPNGWSADAATELQVNASNPTLFSTTVQLVPGNFKFITTQGQFLPSYNKGAGENTLVYRSEDNQPDEQFQITEGGLYKVTVDLENLTLALEQQAGPAYTQLWVVGSATPRGWDLDNAEPMVQSEADPFVFTYTGVLSEGELKIATAKDWGAPFYRPTFADAPISSTEVQLSAGDPDNKWKVTVPGYYKVTLNLREMTIDFAAVDLYLIGDAGPNGWNIGTPEPMAKSGGVYTYTGPLTAGELKISKFKGDWCGGEWINAATANQAITDGAYITTQGCDGPDNKWKVTDATAGNYTLTIDMTAGTMTVVKQ